MYSIIKSVHCFYLRYQIIAAMLHLNRQVYVFCIDYGMPCMSRWLLLIYTYTHPL